MQIIHCDQGTEEWHRVRLGIPTASEFKSVLAKGEGKTRRTYLTKLVGERFTGKPADSYTNGHMERGKEMEAEARDLYVFLTDAELKPVGFVRSGEKGCSPDCLLGSDGMIEIKTRLPHLQVDLLDADRMPPEHKAQVQGALWVAEREWCDFISYWPGLPLFVKRIVREEDYIKTLASEVDAFLNDLHALQDKMIARGATLAFDPATARFDAAGTEMSLTDA